MTEIEELIAVTKRAVVLLAAMDARIGRIEHALCGDSLYSIAEDGVLTRVRSPSQITEGSTTAPVAGHNASLPRIVPIRQGVRPAFNGIPEVGGSR